MKSFIRKIIREEVSLLCNLEHESDRIRYNEIKSSLNEDLWDDEEIYNIDDLYQTEWLSKALNKKDYIDYYELFVSECWESLFKKQEYKNLNKKEAVEKLVKERFSKIAELLNLSIKSWSFFNNILNIKFKKLLRENLLNEKLTNVDDDVNFLYNTYFKQDIDEIEKTGIITKQMFRPKLTSTNILNSKDAIKANELNMCEVFINSTNNYYNPKMKIISFGVNKNAFNFVLEYGGNIKKSIDMLEIEYEKKMLINEFTEEKIKGSIHHELAHWIDDTFHNKHILKRTIKAQELGTTNIGGIPVNITKMEIQGQIHNIKQAYNKHKDIWDSLSFEELVNSTPTLKTIYSSLPNKLKDNWVKNIKRRMHREGLLGKNMVKKLKKLNFSS